PATTDTEHARRWRPSGSAEGRRGFPTRSGLGSSRTPVAKRAAGHSWVRIAQAVGLSVGSLKNWSRTPPAARTLVPVAVATAPEVPTAALVVVSPGGYRVEGLDLATPRPRRRITIL